MAETSRSGGVLHDIHRASRRAEEAALRRYQAVHWLEHFVGPLDIPSEPSEREFISCLRNGLILCNVINKIKPGSVPKVVENHLPLQSESLSWDSQPLPAYQYFENVRNFLVAVRGLNLPAFEASDLERENFEAGSAARIADCILALKSYHEWKEWSGGNGTYKHVTAKSPLVLHSSTKNFSRPLSTVAPQPCRRLDMSAVADEQSIKDSLVKALTDQMVDSKENMNNNFLTSYQSGNQDPVQIFNDILSRCLEEKLRNKVPADASEEASGSQGQPASILKENLSIQNNSKLLQSHRDESRKVRSNRLSVLRSQERDLSDIKALWSQTKRDFEDLQSQLSNDLMHLGSLIEELSGPALGYQKVVQENRKLYNMVQDLKGNIRVYCRIRPILNAEAKNVIDFVGEDGSLVVVDPSKPISDGRKVFQFNQVYNTAATQDELFRDAKPLIRSVMDGFNVCILAYGQAGSGKTHTMYGSSDVSTKDMGIVFFALKDLFEMANKRKHMISYEVSLQMAEICNDQIQDLLVENSTSNGESSLLPDVSLHPVTSDVDAINLVKHGRMSMMSLNNPSSHSHSVVTVHVKGKDASGNNLHGFLHLVDLAGTIGVCNSENRGEDTLQENQLTDKSLSCLEEVLTSLSQKNSHIPYRNCKLTSLLQDALGSRSKILMFAHVSPEGGNFEETVSTLKFAQRVSTIELGAAHSNKKNTEVMELKQEIEILKSQLGEKDPRSPQKQLRSPCEKVKVTAERTPLTSRRLSMENGGSIKTERQPKSPLKRPKVPTESTPQKSLRSSIENPSVKKPEKIRDAGFESSVPRSRRLSMENPVIVRSEKAQRVKEPKSPNEGKKGLTRPTPQKTRRLSIETPISIKSEVGYISTAGEPQSPPSSAYLNQPTFTDCAARFPSYQPPKTPEHKKLEQNEIQTVVMHSGVKALMDSQTPSTVRSTNGKGSQIRKSLRTIGRLINGSEKRNQPKMESLSVKGKTAANEAKSPTTSKGRALRRQSLTGIPPSGPDRRSSLGGTPPTDARPPNNRNAKTPPPVRSSTSTTKRWM